MSLLRLRALLTTSLSRLTIVLTTAAVLVACQASNGESNTATPSSVIGGTVSGLANGQSLVLQLNSGQDETIGADGSFSFARTLTNGSTYAVTVKTQPGGQLCTVTNGTGVVGTLGAGVAITNVSVSCSNLAPQTVTVGGTVSGLGGNLTLALNGISLLPISSDGSFTFSQAINTGGAYVVTITQQPTNQTCVVGAGTGTASANVSSVAVTCSTATYTVGGTVSGSTSAVTLQLTSTNTNESLVVSSAGSFAFTTGLTVGSNYAVTVQTQPNGQMCNVSSGSGTSSTAVTNVAVSCTNLPPATTTVGGSVSGLQGTGLQLSLNSGTPLPISADGGFTFSTPVTVGSSYTVVVTQQPSTPPQSCTITNDTGTAGSSAITNVTVACIAVTPSAPVLTLNTPGVKTLNLSWAAVPWTTNYQLQKNVVNAGWVNDGAPMSAATTSTAVTIPVHLTRWDDTKYRLQACNTGGCTASADVDIQSQMLSSIGYFKASNTHAYDIFGAVVAVSADGNTLAVGAYEEKSAATGINGDQTDTSAGARGAVYVLVRANDGTWSQQAYLKPQGVGPNYYFGISVALSADGNTLAVSASREQSSATGVNGDQTDKSAAESGAVYIFTRNASTWSQEAFIKASNTQPNTYFGDSIALSTDGNTLAVSSPYEDSNASGINGDQSNTSLSNSGAVYVFTRSGSTWSQQAYIKASNPDANDYFGGGNSRSALALSADGNRLAVSSYTEASNATGINGDQTNNLAPNSGAVYLFDRVGSTWSQQAYIKASNAEANDYFGAAVTLSADGNTLVATASCEASAATGINGDKTDNSRNCNGAAYVFNYISGAWVESAYIKAPYSVANRYFGCCGLAISSDGKVVAVGSGDDSAAAGINGDPSDTSKPNSSAIFVYELVGSSWTYKSYVKAPNPDTNDWFGNWLGANVSLNADGSTLVAGALFESSSSTGVSGGNQSDNSAPRAGAVYVY